MIYPATIKELEANPYSFLRERFKESLRDANLLIIVGYSFRDEEILNLVREQTSINADLWLLVVGLHPDEVKNRICGDNREFINRTVTLEKDAQQAFGRRILNNKAWDLARTVKEEKELRLAISSASHYRGIIESNLQVLVGGYKRLNHFSRIKSLVEDVFSFEFVDFDGPDFNLARELYVCAFGFGVESCRQHNWRSAEMWLQLFCGLSIREEVYVMEEISPGTFNQYKQIWQEMRGQDLPWKGISGTRLGSTEMERSIEVDPRIPDEPKISKKNDSIIRSMKNLIGTQQPPFKSKWERVEAYIQNFQAKKIGLIYSIPPLLDLVSTKVDGKDSFVRKWNPGIIC